MGQYGFGIFTGLVSVDCNNMKFSSKYPCQGLEQDRSLWGHFLCSCWVLSYPTEEGTSVRWEDLQDAGSWKVSWPSRLAANLIAQVPQSPSFSVSLNRVMKGPLLLLSCSSHPVQPGTTQNCQNRQYFGIEDGMMSVPLTELLDSPKALGRTYPSKQNCWSVAQWAFSSWGFRDEKGQVAETHMPYKAFHREAFGQS